MSDVDVDRARQLFDAAHRARETLNKRRARTGWREVRSRRLLLADNQCHALEIAAPDALALAIRIGPRRRIG